MKQNRADRVIAELKKQGVTQMLITDPMSVYYLTDVYVQPMERFYALLLKENGDHIFFLNHLFSVSEVTGVQQVWSYDTDPVMDRVAEFIDRDAPLGVDKDLKARFLLPLMEMQAAQSFVNTSVAVDTARGVKDEEEQEKMRVSSDLNDRAMAEFKKLIREGITEREVADQMLKIYEKYGYYKETLVSITMKGVDGAEKIQKILSDMRANPPKEIGTHKVLAVRDYDADTRLDMETGKVTETGLPKSNVLYYELDRDAWCCVRPSGTEPKVKFYMGVKEDSIAHAEAALESLKDAMTELVK